MNKQQSEYLDALMNELEKQNFDKVVNYYNPPTDLMYVWMVRMTVIGTQYRVSVKEMATLIQEEFIKMANELFPEKVN